MLEVVFLFSFSEFVKFLNDVQFGGDQLVIFYQVWLRFLFWCMYNFILDAI